MNPIEPYPPVIEACECCDSFAHVIFIFLETKDETLAICDDCFKGIGKSFLSKWETYCFFI